MAVYVDKLRDWGWRFGPSCHLMADTLDELHEFAALIGMRRRWFQPKSSPHYDLTRVRRVNAVKFGAKVINDKELVALIQQLRRDAK